MRVNRTSFPPDQQTDADLLAATAAADERAFHVLYDRFERRVYGYVRTLIRQPALAEEVTIDAMTAVWQGARGFAGSARVSTWILGIARHKAIDALRKVANRPDALSLDRVDVEDGAATPSREADRDSSARATQRAIAQLSDDHREVLRLAFYEELPYEEIGSLLGIPLNTVKTRVYYAKQQLRKQLARMGIDSAS